MGLPVIDPDKQYVAHTCGGCGITYYVPKRWHQHKLDTQDNFYCPNGCCRHYVNETNADMYKRLYESERRGTELQRRRAENAENSRRALKGVVTRTKNRIKNGVCPCCKRSFTNLQLHMKKQHPKYGNE
jgi:hypothetical protein